MPLLKLLTFSFTFLYCFLTHCSACENDIGIGNNTLQNVDEISASDSFLCRMCGLNIGERSSFIDISSPFSKSERNETVHFTVHAKVVTTKLTVQKLKNPAGVVFDVITVRHSSCKGVGKVLIVLISVIILNMIVFSLIEVFLPFAVDI